MIKKILETPWKIENRVKALLISPIVIVVLRLRGIQLSSQSMFFGFPIVMKFNESTIEMGNYLQLRSTIKSNPLGANHAVILCTWKKEAEIIIGDFFSMTGGIICASSKIKIGNNVIVGANTSIIDSDFHPLDPFERLNNKTGGKSSPVFIDDNVFIGMNCILLKGCRIGKNCVIGAGSVVSGDIPSNSIVAGNPARVIKTQIN